MKGQSQSSRKTLFFFLILTLALTVASFVYAAEEENAAPLTYHLNINKTTAIKGYEIKAFQGEFGLILPKGALKNQTGLDMKKINEDMNLPWQLEKLSDIYQYEILDQAAYDKKKPILAEIKYNKDSDYYKQIYFYDKNYSSWRPLSNCKENLTKSTVRCELNFSFANLAVFANPNVLVKGKASWYSYKKGNFAASPDFPKGSRLRVFNLENNKHVDVEINDFGPERRLYADRVIDLEKTAFKKIAPLNQGTVKIRVEPLLIKHAGGRMFGLSQAGAKYEPNVTAKTAILMDEESGKILWQKNATTSLPLASLTKLAAIKVFLDTRPSLNSIVKYSVKDEEYNYQYANKWEIARLKLEDGDALTGEDLLYAALVGSANNAVETLVRASGLKRADFISKMNDSVAFWGASSTRFMEPTGLSPENVSSALDYAIITKQVYAHPIIQKASVMPNYKFSLINRDKKYNIVNSDKLIQISSLNITGSKTGYLNEAGYCLMARAADKVGRQVIVVTMGAATRDRSFAETEELLKYGLKKTGE